MQFYETFSVITTRIQRWLFLRCRNASKVFCFCERRRCISLDRSPTRFRIDWLSSASSSSSLSMTRLLNLLRGVTTSSSSSLEDSSVTLLRFRDFVRGVWLTSSSSSSLDASFATFCRLFVAVFRFDLRFDASLNFRKDGWHSILHWQWLVKSSYFFPVWIWANVRILCDVTALVDVLEFVIDEIFTWWVATEVVGIAVVTVRSATNTNISSKFRLLPSLNQDLKLNT